MIEYYIGSGIIALLVTLILTKALIPRLKQAGITGKDENKENAPVIPEMGGIAIIAGISAGVLLAIFFNSFLDFDFNLIFVLAALITILMIAIIGISDDLLDLPQWLKATLPLFAAIPLVAVKAAGSTMITIPFFGPIDFGIIYIVALIPLGIAITSNLSNMFAGFNGMEVGMGSVIFGAMALVAIANGSVEMGIIAISMLGALLAFFVFNFYPAKIFPGDVGNLTIGASLASIVIIGNLESAGAILVIPYVIDFFVKAINKFPHTRQKIVGGKLVPDGKVKGLVHIVMKAFGGISEKNLVIFFIAVEMVFAAVVLLLYL
ncbi:UDP-N-acetylglucosamine--dolichyl-phosphate N-acetylglucosaminephosphotransferase [Candidatus Micrarchaeota archaeon]|nr:UDP-N-acetylglucosamine--dolichyl-phosphate N-acetylglucosaminephosphotransferase [Candidatus Micrarchaeota archaeon]